MTTCSAEGCETRAKVRGFCQKHFERFKRNGHPGLQYVPTVEERFWSYVNKDGGYPDFSDPLVLSRPDDGPCWNWTGSLQASGHGIFNQKKGSRLSRQAHRFSYEINIGPIPDGLVIDHRCRNRRCVNPEHLEAVTIRENNRRGGSITAQNLRKTHCPQGHEYTEKNTYYDKLGYRHCVACRKNSNNKVR